MGTVSLESLPLGFRFRPTDEELVNHYLRLKINGRHSDVHVIPEIDVCKWEPEDLPRLSVIKTDDPEWFFFCPRDRKYPNGQRSNRATDAGYWKATGKDRMIRSRAYRSPSNTTGSIGMKKTLVFYRGRAPKGERTHWIMHEYRPTLKDLDGTGPGQDAYVLCRLFRKPQENTDASKYDEVNHTGSSPTTSKSSPDDTCSDMVQETATSNIPVGGYESEVMKVGHFESAANSFMASDVEDHAVGGTPVEVHRQLEYNSKSDDPTYDHLFMDSLLPSQFDLPGTYASSPYACDFGNDNNGYHFLDGTGEQDISLSDLLDGALPNQDESSCEESTYQDKPFAGRESHLLGQPQLLPNMLPGSFNNCSYRDTDTDTAQAQSGPPRIEAPWSDQQLRNMTCQPGDSFSGQVPFGGGYAAMYDSFEGPNGGTEPVNYYGNSDGTGIKIRPRQPQRPVSNNFDNQGIAPRRIRFHIGLIPESLTNDATRILNQSRKDDEVQSTVSVVDDVMGQSSSLDEKEGEYTTACLGAGPRIKIRTRHPGGPRINSLQMGTTHLSKTDEDDKDVNQTEEEEDDDELQSTITDESLEDEEGSEDEIQSLSSEDSGVTDKVRDVLKCDISEDVTKESYTEPADEGTKMLKESSAEPMSKISEISSAQLKLRIKNNEDGALEVSETLPRRHFGLNSLIISLGICAVIVVFFGSISSFCRALDVGVS